MDVLEEYDNKKIILGEDGLPRYVLTPYPFTDKEKELLHNSDKLFTQIELESIRKEPDISLRRLALHDYLKMKLPDTKNKELLIESSINKVLGYGGLGEFIADPNLEEIMVNGVNMPVFVFHKRHGMCITNVIFKNKDEIFRIINRLCWIHEKEIAPIIDLSTVDGSRVNITTDPVATHGPTLTIRKQKRNLLTITELLEAGTLDIEIAALLWLSVDGMRLCPANLVVAGMIGSGKTTLLNALAMLTPPEDRIITIEDTAEMQLAGRQNWVSLVSQKGYDMEALVRNTLRMRPNRIVVGEIRGAEAMALFNAMNVGHKGMGTMHASSSREVIYRLKSPPMNVPSMVISNLDLIVIMNIFNIRGKPIRRITEVAEVAGREGDTVLLGEIYQWDPKSDKAVVGEEMTPAMYLDKLSRKVKIDKRKLVEELEKRKTVLISLVNDKVFEYKEVMAAIDEFYRIESDLEVDMAKEIKDKPK